MDIYIQCELTKTTQTGKIVTIHFIPEKFAKINKTLKIDGDEEDWKVTEVYKDSRREVEDINRTKAWKELEVGGRKSYKD